MSAFHHIRANNVNDLYPAVCRVLANCGEWQDSRGGRVLVLPGPMMTQINDPRDRVLLSEKRDANPFFHVAESIWMMAGARNAKFLDIYVKDFSKKYGQDALKNVYDEGDIHGAYGYRWRNHFGVDQLLETVERLKKDPFDRRVVISMWDAAVDFDSTWLNDYPCNTHIYPRIVDNCLDMTVCCRSNDAIWGAMGANIFHFSFLQEWLASAIGVEVGCLYQLSNNYHVYEKIWEKRKDFLSQYPYNNHNFHHAMLVLPDEDPMDFLLDCQQALDENNEPGLKESSPDYRTFWFTNVWFYVRLSHELYREGAHHMAKKTAEMITAPDISVACQNWLERRTNK